MGTDEYGKITRSAEETIAFGKAIGKVLKPNAIIALEGQLGAGKTTLVQGIAEGLGVSDYITSPTFIIINEYKGRFPLYHFDLYRLENINAIEELGIEEYFNRGGVCVIEWAEKLGDFKPASLSKINFDVISEQERKICVSSELAALLR
ncbi:MAG: tRNA (adenosine(37)-N6)-threonylcarbamoyltransferase complex ATPase subunit type 1 TsaE [Candidatus Margulisiibacteriota bacterium]